MHCLNPHSLFPLVTILTLFFLPTHRPSSISPSSLLLLEGKRITNDQKRKIKWNERIEKKKIELSCVISGPTLGVRLFLIIQFYNYRERSSELSLSFICKKERYSTVKKGRKQLKTLILWFNWKILIQQL